MSNHARARSLDAALLLLLCVAALLFWKFRIIDPAAAEPFRPNLANVDFFTYTQPVLSDAAASIREGRIPLWNPYQSAGHPTLAGLPAGVLYPLNAPFLFLRSALAIEVVVVLHLILAAVFVYLYARSIPIRPEAALASALAFAFSGYVVSRAGWFLPAVSACVWLPLAFLAIDRIMDAPRPALGWVCGLALAVAMPVLAGWPQLWVYSLYAIALYAGARIVSRLASRENRHRTWVPALLLVAAGALAAALAAVQLLPTLELQGLGARGASELPIEQALLFGAVPPGDLLAAALSGSSAKLDWCYLGALAVLLIPLSCMAPAGRLRVAVLWLLAIFSIGIALTTQTPLFAFFWDLPSGSWFRSPQRILFLYTFSGALLMGVGLDSLLARLAGGSRGGVSFAVAGAALLAAALTRNASLEVRDYTLLSLAGVLLVAIVIAPARARSALAWALVGFVGVDLFLATSNRWQHPYHVPPNAVHREADVLEWVRDHQGEYRTYFFSGPGINFAMMDKLGTVYGIRSITDYEPLSVARLGRVFRELELRPDAKPAVLPFYGNLRLDAASPNLWLLDLMSVRWALVGPRPSPARDALAAASDPWRERYRPRADGYSVFENPGALPRAYVVFDWLAAPDGAAAFDALLARSVDVRRAAVIEGVEALPRRAGATDLMPARIVEQDPRRVVVEVETSTRGHLVLTDTFYPGWVARVNGDEQPIRAANYLFRAVALEPGANRVEFRYEPRSFRIGASLSGLGIVALAACAAYSVLQRRRPRIRQSA